MTAETVNETRPEPAATSSVRGFVDPAVRAAFYRAVATLLPACDHDLLATLSTLQTSVANALDGDPSRKPMEKALQRAVDATVAAYREQAPDAMGFGFFPPLLKAGFGRITMAEHLALTAVRVIEGKVSPTAPVSLRDAADAVKETLK